MSLFLSRHIYLLHNLGRRYATHPNLTPQHSIYVSNSTNPYFNLTFEDWQVTPNRSKPPESRLTLTYF